MNNKENFYVVRRESGTQRSDLPVWAPKSANPFALDKNVNAVSRAEVSNVPGAFQLLDVLLPEEVQRILDGANQLGFTEDAAVSLPREVRHNQNLNLIADTETLDVIWKRCQDHFVDKYNHFAGVKPLVLTVVFAFIVTMKGISLRCIPMGRGPAVRLLMNS